MKILRLLVVLVAIMWFFQDASAQFRSRYFYVGVSAGVTNYKGDLDDNFTLKFTKPGFGIVGGYKFHPHMGLRLAFNQGWMKASDASAASDVPRLRRNLSFRSPITEASLVLTYEFFANNRKYKFRPQYTPYLLGGIAAFVFNPQGKLGNDWIDLQPRGTEGQFLVGCPDCPQPYSLVQIAIPFGVGLRYKLTDRIDLNFEVAMRKTFTDYLDDVSGEYPDMDALRASDPTAYLLSDRIDRGVYPEGAKYWNGIRGDKTQDDWYVMSMVTATYILDWVKCPKFR